MWGHPGRLGQLDRLRDLAREGFLVLLADDATALLPRRPPKALPRPSG